MQDFLTVEEEERRLDAFLSGKLDKPIAVPISINLPPDIEEAKRRSDAFLDAQLKELARKQAIGFEI